MPEPRTVILSEERVGALAAKILEPLKAHMQAKPADRLHVLESLNALALAAGIILVGTNDPDALAFFELAICRTLLANLPPRLVGPQ